MVTVSDELVERVALALLHSPGPSMQDAARAAIAALSTPEFVLPLAEEMLRGKRARRVALIGSTVSVSGIRQELPGGQQAGPTESYGQGASLLAAFEEME